jgi:Fic family protein
MNRYYERIENLPNSVHSKVARLLELKGEWRGSVNLSPDILNRLKKSVLITSAGASTRIEGATLSDAEVESFINGLKTKRMTDRSEQEVQGYYELLSMIFDNYYNVDFTENNILALHSNLMHFVSEAEYHRGSYKKLDNSVIMKGPRGENLGVVFQTEPALTTPQQTKHIIDWTDEALKHGEHQPILIITAFIIEFLRIHPFIDGNGRMSRLLTNLLMLQQDYLYIPYISQEKLIEDTKAEYYIALRRSQATLGTDKEDISAWAEYILTIFIKQAELALELLSVTRLLDTLSPAQTAVYNYLLTVPEASPLVIAESTGTNRRTVSQAIDRLLSFDIIKRLGSGRATRYRIKK